MNESIKFKRYCKTMKLENDSELIEAYKKAHTKEHFWPEITQGMSEVGILDMEIYIYGNQLFMIMDTIPNFDHDAAMQRLANKPRHTEWEKYVARFQNTSADASADEKWQLMDRIYKLDQKKEYKAENGQLEEVPSVF